jgi:hypothetical protein
VSKEKRFELLNMLSFKDKFFDNKNKRNLDSLDVVRILNHYEKTLSEFVKRDVEQQNKITDLETKLAEKDKENDFLKLQTKEYLEKGMLIVRQQDLLAIDEKHNQDKISFAVEQLEKVKEWFISNSTHDYCNNAVLIDYTIPSVVGLLDNKIKQLKEGK